MNAIVGVAVAGAEKAGALCLSHWTTLRIEPGLTFYYIKRNTRRCTACVQLRKQERS